MTPTPTSYPAHWWAPVSKVGTPDWEILPQAGVVNQTVILSKRHELGILSNFAATPFQLDGKTYASVEGLWQSTTYPDPKVADDPRAKCRLPYTREQVAAMTSFKAKAAGDAGEACMKKLKIDWVSFGGRKMRYREKSKGLFYQLIRKAMEEKLEENPEVKKALLSTRGLSLLPDHYTQVNDPAAWRYFEIWQEIREGL